MKDEQLDDLKQFIEATVSQTEARLTQKIDALEQKMDDGFAGVGDAIEEIHKVTGDHEVRITGLEQQAA
jgi:hypothetical protein